MDHLESGEADVRKETAKYLYRIGQFLSNSCPPASRYYVSNFERKLNEFPDLTKKEKHCSHCGSLFDLKNCRIRVKPRRKRNMKLLKIEPWKLNNRQKQKIKRIYGIKNKIVHICFICNKKTIDQGTKTLKAKNLISNTSTPLPKIKKGDLSAGLCIPYNGKNDLEDSQSSSNEHALETSMKNKAEFRNKNFASADSSDISTDKNDSIDENKSSSLGILSESSPSSQKVSTCKKTLLAQVLGQQNKKTKTSSSYLNNSLDISNSSRENANNSVKSVVTPPSIKISKSSSSQKHSAGKKKNTLLAQIINQEQNVKKTSLSSFLVSL